MLGVKGFVAAAIGGLSSIAGAVIGGILLGILEAYSSGLISSGLKDAISIMILLGVLLIRPEGILTAIKERKI
jgi:branched-chain amino acid transport system permease protein